MPLQAADVASRLPGASRARLPSAAAAAAGLAAVPAGQDMFRLGRPHVSAVLKMGAIAPQAHC
jgi:hypothetical protein